jgi:hypothetical protein
MGFPRVRRPARRRVRERGRRPAGLLAVGIEPEASQQLQDVERVRPVLRPGLAAPPAVWRLEREQPGASALGRDPRPLGGDDVRRLVGQVAHHLPADRGLGVEEPIDDVHGHAAEAPAERAATTRSTACSCFASVRAMTATYHPGWQAQCSNRPRPFPAANPRRVAAPAVERPERPRGRAPGSRGSARTRPAGQLRRARQGRSSPT